MPITTTLKEGVAVGVETTINSPDFTTMPVRSSTPFASNDESYSMYSDPFAFGVDEVATANLTCADAELDRFKMFTVTTANVLAGQVYTVVLDPSVMGNAPNLPVAI